MKIDYLKEIQKYKVPKSNGLVAFQDFNSAYVNSVINGDKGILAKWIIELLQTYEPPTTSRSK